MYVTKFPKLYNLWKSLKKRMNDLSYQLNNQKINNCFLTIFLLKPILSNSKSLCIVKFLPVLKYIAFLFKKDSVIKKSWFLRTWKC